jgi:hypothetical protein
MSGYRTIKDLVIETCISEGAFPSYEKITSLVRQHFPTSKWQKTHYAWYKSRIKNGEISVPGISAEMSAPSSDEADVAEGEIEAAIDTSVSLERDLHLYLASGVQEPEPG